MMEDPIEKREAEDPNELTLRDQFALGALTGLLSDSANIVEFRRTAHANSRTSAMEAARAAYAFADQMMRQRKIPACEGRSLGGRLPAANDDC